VLPFVGSQNCKQRRAIQLKKVVVLKIHQVSGRSSKKVGKQLIGFRLPMK
jgi:hypothetical protein